MKKSLAFAAVAVVSVAAGARWRQCRGSASLELSSVERQSLQDAPNEDKQSRKIDLKKLGLDASDAAPVATPDSAPRAAAQKTPSAGAAAPVSGKAAEVADILGQIVKLDVITCSGYEDNGDGGYEDDGCTTSLAYFKDSVDSQVKIALNLAQEMIDKGQLQEAADAVSGIKTLSKGYLKKTGILHRSPIMSSGDVLYDKAQVDHLVDMALAVIQDAQSQK